MKNKSHPFTWFTYMADATVSISACQILNGISLPEMQSYAAQRLVHWVLEKEHLSRTSALSALKALAEQWPITKQHALSSVVRSILFGMPKRQPLTRSKNEKIGDYGYVYIAQLFPSVWKIGKTISPQTRISHIRQSYGAAHIECVCYCRNYHHIERYLHEKYRHKSLGMAGGEDGELFSMSELDLKRALRFMARIHTHKEQS